MKVLLSLTVIFLILGLALSQEHEKNVNDNLESPQDAEPLQEIADDIKEEEADNAEQSDETEQSEDTEKSDDTDVQDTKSDEASDESVKAEHLIVHMTPGKKIILTINPGSYGGYYGSGTTYTRWGKYSCRRGAQRLFHGRVGGGHYSQRGNGASYMCMPNNPQYLSTQTVPAASYIYGAEYESANRMFGKTTHDYNVPCAVCFVPRKSSTIVIPARYTCPRGWWREYYGYYMSSYFNHPQNVDPVCVDRYPDIIPGSQKNTNGILFYFMRVICNTGLPCSSSTYITTRAITCAVCTK